ncbi:MAG: M3 family oligoendopeptidase [Caldilineaceae bacterium]|nr:M3 family oligoendopeptidase [Caldilineaceae bacterium]
MPRKVSSVIRQKEGDSNSLPHWDMTVVFPSLDSPEFAQGFQRAIEKVDQLEALFDSHAIGNPQADPQSTEKIVEVFEAVLEQINNTMDVVHELASYVSSFLSTNSRNDQAQAAWSRIQLQSVRLSKLGTRLTAWLGQLPVDELVQQSALAAEHAYALEKARIQSQHLLARETEDLAADLSPTGGDGWAKLYSNYTSQLLVPIRFKGKPTELPMSSVRNLAYHETRSVRRLAYEAELKVWKDSAVPLAAALNSIKGEVNTLVRHRRWDSALQTTLVQNNMDHESLDAMLSAARDAFPDFRRYFRAKAGLVNGDTQLAWYDLFAPIGNSPQKWPYAQATEFITQQFATFSPKMRDLAVRSFRENWIDAEPRPGKRDGAFCMRLRKDESRILMNYKESFNSVSTLAHELGHAYHNLNLAGRTTTQRVTPMTLAETASIFCETVVTQAALAEVGPAEQFVILEASLQSTGQVVVDIASRFLFENALFASRQERELSIDELCALMTDAQQQTYGDALQPDLMHPFMWAAKSHYYNGSRSFYNYPYMFGQLFALGLFARYQADPDGFRTAYDDLLSSTGMANAADLAARFGIDIRTPAFWQGSLNVIRADIDRFEQLAQDQSSG